MLTFLRGYTWTHDNYDKPTIFDLLFYYLEKNDIHVQCTIHHHSNICLKNISKQAQLRAANETSEVKIKPHKKQQLKGA